MRDPTRGSSSGELRVGDQQLVEIAKALSLDTDILIMDEPTSALTETEVARLFRVIERLRSRGVTILYISHKMDEVFRLADRITVLRDGATGRRPSAAARPRPREITHLMVGREIEETDLGRPRAAGEVVLEVEDLSLPWPGHARKWRLRRHQLHAPPRRDPRHGRPDGRRPHGTAGMPVRRQPARAAGRDHRSTASSVVVPPSGRGHARRHRLVTEDRKRLGLFANLNVGQNISDLHARPGHHAGPDPLPARARHGRGGRSSSWA